MVPGQGEYWNPTFITVDGRRTVEGYPTDIITDLAMEWVESPPPVPAGAGRLRGRTVAEMGELPLYRWPDPSPME